MLNKYIFCYFTGNEPENESVHFAVSKDGYHFDALKNNEKIITQTLGKKCCRDPFIFRDEDNIFHIIATDMRCCDGWSSNNSMIVWDSRDLVNWENERIIDFSQFEETKSANRVWAPQVIFDKFKNAYMIYWTHNNTDDDLDTITWYAYTNDLKTLTTRPAVLFKPKSGLCGIDADIIEVNGKYYLYQADGEKEAICYAVADRPDGPYFEPDNNKVSVADTALEGNCIYRIIGTDKYVLIADKFKAGGYFMQETSDMINFKKVSDFSLDHLHPRHGSVMHITDEEYERLKKAFC
ncbi:MAG: glycoside hydrolase family 43 protein [Oscillospiraceae bacterium]|nr:glycoside hydrolase family 43 protein [Oscillospiraceae bacterium]